MMPETSTKEKRAIVLIDRPVYFMIITAKRKEKGMPIAVSMAFLNPRISHNATVTNSMPNTILPVRVLMESYISMVESRVSSIAIPSFLCDSSKRPQTSLIALAILTESPLGSFLTTSLTELFPLTEKMRSGSLWLNLASVTTSLTLMKLDAS